MRCAPAKYARANFIGICPRNRHTLRLNAAIYLTWAAKYLQFSKTKTQENFLKIA